jgi:hypothetical protein
VRRCSSPDAISRWASSCESSRCRAQHQNIEPRSCLTLPCSYDVTTTHWPTGARGWNGPASLWITHHPHFLNEAGPSLDPVAGSRRAVRGTPAREMTAHGEKLTQEGGCIHLLSLFVFITVGSVHAVRPRSREFGEIAATTSRIGMFSASSSGNESEKICVPSSDTVVERLLGCSTVCAATSARGLTLGGASGHPGDCEGLSSQWQL